MLDRDMWRTEPNGMLTTDTEEFRLVVQRVDGVSRFLVFQRGGPAGQHSSAILASGTEESVQAAMSAANRMAQRLSASGREG